MTVTSAQVTTLLENVLFESATLAKANATQVTAYANLSSSTSTVAGLSAFLATQAEASIAEQVVRYYQGALGRVPAPVEIAYYVAIAEQGLSSAQIAEGTTAVSGSTWATIASYFAASPEFKADFGLTGATTNEAIVITGFYHNILGRAPSAAELTYYEGLVNSGTSYATLIQYFTESPEYQAIADSTIQSNLAAAGTTAVATVAAGGTPLTSTTPIGSLPSGAQGSSTSLTFNSATATYVAGVTVTGTAGSSANTLSLNDGGENGTFNLSLPAGATVSNIQTLNVNGSGTDALTLSATGSAWSSLTTLNFTSGGAQAITVGSGVAITDTDTLTSAASPTSTTIDGGSSVTLTATGSAQFDLAANDKIGDIVIGGTTAPAGVVAVTATETITAGTGGADVASVGNITVDGGVGVTVNSTVNTAVATSGAYSTTFVAGQAGLISVAPTSGAVVVNSATNTTATAATVVNADAISVTGGSSITVTETAAANQKAANISTVDEGAVSVTGDSTTTTVSVTQAAANTTGNLAIAAVSAVSGVSAASAVTAGPGVDASPAVTAVNGGDSVSAAAAVTGTDKVVDAAVTIADAKNTSTSTSTITSVTLENYGASTFAGAALTTLTLGGTAGTLGITNGAAAGATNTTLALDVNGLSGTDTITDVNGEITTLNVTTGATKSSLTGFIDAGLKTIDVSGASVLTLGASLSTANDADLTKIVVSGAAGLTADVHSFGAALAVTTTSSGTITLTLDDTTQTFTGSTGQDVITIGADATKAITGGSATNNEIILGNNVAGAGNADIYSSTGFTKYVTGFTTLGINDATATNVNTYDLHSVFTGFTAIDLQSSMTGAQTFNNVATGTALQIDAGENAVAYNLYTASSTGSVAVTLNTASATAGITVGTLTLNDSNGDGIATLNVTSNAKASVFTSGATDTQTNNITTLADTGLTALNISGNAALNVGTISLGQPGQTVPVGVASFSITDNSTGFDNTGSVHVASTIGTFTDDTLGSLTFAGTNAVVITTLNDNNAVNLTITNNSAVAEILTLSTDANANHASTTGLSNLTFAGSGFTYVGDVDYTATNTAALTYTQTGAGSVEIDAITGASTTTSLTLSGSIQLGIDDTSVANNVTDAITLADTAGVTVAAITDNAHIDLTLTGALTGATDTVTVGNGNNVITDDAGTGASGGTVNITVGTGSNYIDVAHNAAGNAAVYNITLGTHTSTGPDEIVVSEVGTSAGVNTTITNSAAGDLIKITDGATTGVQTLTSGEISTFASETSLANALTYAHSITAAHEALVFTYGPNTYVVEDVAAHTAAATSTVIELVGSHSLTATSTAGIFAVS